jgi:hypothetical protein
VSLIIISLKNAPLERYVFDFSLFPSVPSAANYDDPILQQGEGDQRDEIAIANLEAQFRACLLRLSVCTPKLGKLPEDCTYTVAVEMKEPGAPANVGYFCRRLGIVADVLIPVRRNLGSRRKAGKQGCECPTKQHKDNSSADSGIRINKPRINNRGNKHKNKNGSGSVMATTTQQLVIQEV